MGRVAVWARPGSLTDELAWDPWRRRWVVSCRAPPTGGQANEAIALLLSEWLHVPRGSVRWVSAGRSRAKLIEVDGLTDPELEERLRSRRKGPSA